MSELWTEVGDRVFVRRYRFFDQDVVVVLGGDGALVVDTRYTPAQAREVLDDLRELGSPRVGVVVNTHGHGDHCNGNSVFRPAPIWGHERCATMIRLTGEQQRLSGLAETPDVAGDLAEVVLDPPDHTFTDRATLDLDGRIVDLAYLGRGHTDNDIVITIADADVLCVGDLLENGAPPWFGDGYPMDWPATARAILDRTGERTVVVPGHGAHAGPGVRGALARRDPRDRRPRDAHPRAASWTSRPRSRRLPIGPPPSREALERGVAQLRGELDA